VAHVCSPAARQRPAVSRIQAMMRRGHPQLGRVSALRRCVWLSGFLVIRSAAHRLYHLAPPELTAPGSVVSAPDTGGDAAVMKGGDGLSSQADALTRSLNACTLDTEEPPEFGSGPEYWDGHYREDPAPYDWLEEYSGVRSIIDEATGSDVSVRILHVGCGNSLLPENMYDAGYKNIVNIDNSPVVIKQMFERNVGRPKMTWSVMDATSTSFEDETFDVVIDKSVLDTFTCMLNSTRVVRKYLREVVRVLKPWGRFVCISFGEPPIRMPLLEKPRLFFDIEVWKGPPPKDNCLDTTYVYVGEALPMLPELPS